MPAQLIALNEGNNILLDKPILLVGRDPECDVQIESRKISRRHCVIAQVNDYLVVRDLESTNGIRVNGVRVQEGKLRGNDELTIGSSRYRVSWDLVPALPPARDGDDPPTPTLRGEVVDVDSLGSDDAVFEFDSSDEPVALEEDAEGSRSGTAKVEAAKKAASKPVAPTKEPDWRRATAPLPPSEGQAARKPRAPEPDWRRATAPLPPEEETMGGVIIPDDLDLIPLKDDDSKDARK